MKRDRKEKAFSWGLGLSILLTCVFHALCSKDQHFTFDSLFPKNSFAKATEHCVSVWGALDQMIKSGIPSVQFIRNLDRSIGQLVLAQRQLQKSVQETKLEPDQCHYLARVVGTISDRYQKLPHIDFDRAECLKHQIDGVKEFVEQQLTLIKK